MRWIPMTLRSCRTGWLCRFRALSALLVFVLAASTMPLSASAAGRAEVLEINGAIGPAVADYVVRQLKAVKPGDAHLIVLRMDTPGGLDTSMREIIRAILASPVPVAAFVAPGGARAASAGTYITYACAIAVMAPGTNLGAATPIQMGGLPALPSGQPQPPATGKNAPNSKAGSAGETHDTTPPEPSDTEGRKVLNDAVAYIRGLAELNGRNADWAVQAVRGAVSLPASEALKLHVIDVIADDVPDLLRKVDGRTVTVAGKPVRLQTTGLEVVTIAPDWRTKFLSVITDPNIAYLLMLLGFYGLIFELTNPGAVLPGVIGTISLILALFSLNMLPVDYAGAGLVLLGLGLMVAEAVIGAFGVIGVGGIVAFLVGSVIMFGTSAPGVGLSLSVVIAATVVSAGFFLLVLAMLIHSRRRPVITGAEGLIGSEGAAVAWRDGEGTVRVKGEIWRAHAADSLKPGDRVRVVGREGLVLKVEPNR